MSNRRSSKKRNDGKTPAQRSAAAKKAAQTRKKNKKQKDRVKAAGKAISTIETKGSREDFPLKKSVFSWLSKKSKDKYRCACCKHYFEPHFLTIDHKFGRNEIPRKNRVGDKELKKIDYSAKRGGKSLRSWLDKHGRKPIIIQHFQVLCFNCNVAKFLYRKCPHKRKRNR